MRPICRKLCLKVRNTLSSGKFVRRFVELPDGTTIRLPSRKAQTRGFGDRQVSIVPDEIVDITETRIDTIV